MTLIKSISGIRGIVNDGFDNNTIKTFAIAFSKIQNCGPILVARDGRNHGLAFSNQICQVLTSINRPVIDCGIIPTPTAQFIVTKNNYSGGIVITASHNPTNWNGLKFIDDNGCFLSQNKNEILLNTLSNSYDKNIENQTAEILDYHNQSIIDHLINITNLSVIDLNRIRRKKYKIVVDAINSSASKILPMLLKKFGCNVITLNCDSNGEFTRGAEPLPAHLSEISKTVIDTNSDLGIATDPDADRLAIIDETGTPIGEESTLVICCESLLKDGKIKTPIVTNLSTSMAIDNLSNQYNINVIRSKVGEINVVNEMKKRNSIFGGEGNGGVILAESHYGRDSLVATALLLNRLSMEEISVSQLYNKIPHYEIIKDFIKTDKSLDKKFIKLIKEELQPVEINELDGIKLIWPDKWIHIRKSNTEPIIRFYSESNNIETSIKLINQSKELFDNQ